MRSRFVIYTLILFFTVLALVFWLRPMKHPANPEPAPVVQTTNNVAVPPATSAATASVAHPNVPGISLPAVLPRANPNPATNDADRRERVIQEYNAQHNAPIEFYGLVIDQDSNALPGVKISAEIQQPFAVSSPTNLVLNNNVVRPEKETGTDGRFEITGESGDGVYINSIQKDAYEWEHGQRSYGTIGGSFNNPVIFKMWSTNIHEQLIKGERKFPIVPDGRPYVIDLSKGAIAESGAGDLKIWVKRPDPITYGKRYDWSCEADAINGGLLQESDDTSSMYSAPAGGYTPSFQFEQKVGSGWGDTTGPKRFYVELNNGQEYGRITIELEAYYNDQIPGMVRLSYAINPSGSRILR